MTTLKIMRLLTGTLVAAAVAVTPLTALAQSSGQQPSRPPQQGTTEIELSPQQQTQFKQIRDETLARIEKVLTKEQMTQFRNQGPRGVQNLSEKQRTELQQIFEGYVASIRGILTKEQLQLIEQSQSSKPSQPNR